MDKTATVSLDFARGSELIETLDRTKLKVDVALWAYLAEFEDWRLVIAARQFNPLGLRESYRLLHDSLVAAGFGRERTPTVMILPMADPLIRELRRMFAKTRSLEGMRLGGQLIGDRFVEDGYVYKIS